MHSYVTFVRWQDRALCTFGHTERLKLLPCSLEIIIDNDLVVNARCL